MTGADLAGWSRVVRAGPSSSRFRDVEVAKTDLWGQGPVLLAGAGHARRAARRGARPVDAPTGVHTVTEVLKLALRRPRGVVRRRVAGHRRRAARPGVRRGAAGPGRRAGLGGAATRQPRRPRRRGCPSTCAGRRPRLRRGRTRRADGLLGRARPAGDTCHIDVVDRWGNIISATPSGGWLQSSPTIPELGFCLGSRLQMFWLDEGLPAALAPGRRPRTTLSPTLVLRDGGRCWPAARPAATSRTSGSCRSCCATSSAAWTCRRRSTRRRSTPPRPELLLPARDGPRRAGRRGPPRRRRARRSWRRAATAVRAGRPWSLGRLCAVARDPDTGLLSAAANPRGAQGYAVGR